MSFNRRRVQEVYESEFGYTADDIYSNRKSIRNNKLSPLTVASLRQAADLDLKDYYFKALVSFYESVFALQNGNFSWATVKLYYCTFYLLQTELLVRGTVIIRAGSLHKLLLRVGEFAEARTAKRYNTDHSGTIHIYLDSFGSSDPLLSNKINGMDSYMWLMQQRERVNYKERSFSEPNYPDFWSGPVSNGIVTGNTESIIEMYINDDIMSLTFQEDHAIMGLPLRKFVEVTKLLKNYGHSNILSVDQKVHLRGMLGFKILEQFIEI